MSVLELKQEIPRLNNLSNGWVPVATNFGSLPFNTAVTNTTKSQFYRAVAIL
jgi:hypothetical protein